MHFYYSFFLLVLGLYALSFCGCVVVVAGGVRERERRSGRQRRTRNVCAVDWPAARKQALHPSICRAMGSVEPGTPSFYIYILVIIGLVLFAGMMSGLTLGLMSLGLVDLEVLLKSGQPADRKHAGNYRFLSLSLSLSLRVSLFHLRWSAAFWISVCRCCDKSASFQSLVCVAFLCVRVSFFWRSDW